MEHEDPKGVMKELYAVPRLKEFEELLVSLFRAVAPGKNTFFGVYFQNSTFELQPHCWCSQDECPQCSSGAPNFNFIPEGITVSWYKYPLNAAISNQPLTVEKFADIIGKCADSLGTGQISKR